MMKASKSKNSHNSSSLLHQSKTSSPFFQKESQNGFDSKSKAEALPFFQTKLTIGQPNDKYEQEADRIADAVVSQNTPQPVVQAKNISSIQRYMTNAEFDERGTNTERIEEDKRIQEKPEVQRKAIFESGEENIQRKCTECEQEEGAIQGKSAGGEMTASAGLQSRLNATKGGGSSLPENTRTSMETSMGADFGGVRIHTGSTAVQMNRDLGAQAFTHGRDVYFNSGKYDTGSREGKRLLGHELVHVVQQGGAINLPANKIQRLTPASPEASAPPAPNPLPGVNSFAPLSPGRRNDRVNHGMYRDSGSLVSEIESEVFPTGGANPSCVPIPPDFESTVSIILGPKLVSDVPNLSPTDAGDPMTIASDTAKKAMPIINSYYSPYAPSVAPATFMASVSRKSTNYGNRIRNRNRALGEFLAWYAGNNSNLRSLIGDKCNIDEAWWTAYASWLNGAGSAVDIQFQIRERSALFDTYSTSTTQGGFIEFGRGFEISSIPFTVIHEAMHKFTHPNFDRQVSRLEDSRSSTDIFSEGFTEYLARAIRDSVVDAIQTNSPPTLSPGNATRAKQVHAYKHYFDKTVEIRDILYRHGQDGEEAIRRAYFLGEGWRFGLLENSRGAGSPIETDRPIPPPVDVHFDSNGRTINDPSLLASIIAYVTTRSIARVEIIGRTDEIGSRAANLSLGRRRARAVKSLLRANGIRARRISRSSRGEADQIAGGEANNRRATVTVIDSRNQFPGIAAPGRP